MTNQELLGAAIEEMRLAAASLGGARMSRDHDTTIICLDAFYSHLADALSYVRSVRHVLGSPVETEVAGVEADIPCAADNARTIGEPTHAIEPGGSTTTGSAQ